MRGIRGHHLFCMAQFSGHGYDQPFAVNMGRLIEELRAGQRFQLVLGQDAVCAACPNQQEDGGCALGTGDVQWKDHAVQQLLHIEPGEEITWREAMKKILGLEEPTVQRVCGSCRWAQEGLCSFALLHKRAEEALRPEGI